MRLQAQAYEDKLTDKITEGFWRERTAAWREEEREVRGGLAVKVPTITRHALLDRATKHFELLQHAISMLREQRANERSSCGFSFRSICLPVDLRVDLSCNRCCEWRDGGHRRALA